MGEFSFYLTLPREEGPRHTTQFNYSSSHGSIMRLMRLFEIRWGVYTVLLPCPQNEEEER